MYIHSHYFCIVCVCVCVCAVDDGSGVLSCTQWRRSEDSSEGLYVPSIGQLVSVFGRVEEYRAEKQLKVSAIGSYCIAGRAVQCYTGTDRVLPLCALPQFQRRTPMLSPSTGWKWSRPRGRSTASTSHYLTEWYSQPSSLPRRGLGSSFLFIFSVRQSYNYVEDKYTNKCCPIMYVSIVHYSL